jgi:hypothetical protein
MSCRQRNAKPDNGVGQQQIRRKDRFLLLAEAGGAFPKKVWWRQNRIRKKPHLE